MVGKAKTVVNVYDENATDPSKGYSGLSEMKYLKADGTIVSYNYAIFIITEYISVKPNTAYNLHGNFTNAAASAWCLYDSQKNYIKGEAINRRSEMLIETTSDTAYIRFSPNLVSDGLSSIVLNEGATPLTPGATIWEPCTVKLYHKSANLFDMSAITPNSLLNRDTGAVTPASSFYAVSDFIPVETGNYSYTLNDYGNRLPGGADVVFYDAQKGYISGDFVRWDGSIDYKYMTIAVPAGVAYMRVNTTTELPPEDAQQMINRGAVLPYEPYSGETWHDIDDYIRHNGAWVQQ